MPKFTVDHQSEKSPLDAFSIIKKILTEEAEVKKFDQNAQVAFDETAHNIHIKGSQFSANMNVKPAKAGSMVSVTVDIPFLLLPFKGKIQESLLKMFKKHQV